MSTFKFLDVTKEINETLKDSREDHERRMGLEDYYKIVHNIIDEDIDFDEGNQDPIITHLRSLREGAKEGGNINLESLDDLYRRCASVDQQLILEKQFPWLSLVEDDDREAANALKVAQNAVETLEEAVSTYIANEDVEDLLIEIEKTNVKIKHLQKHKDACREDLKGFVEENAMIKDLAGHLLATWSYHEKSFFDLDDFKKDYPVIYQKYLRKRQERRLDIKRRPF